MKYFTLKKTSRKHDLRSVFTLMTLAGVCFAQSLQASTISTAQDIREVTSSPLLYKQLDYSRQQASFELEPWISSSWNPERIMANIGINGQSSMSLNQLGTGDINPEWILLAAHNNDRNYESVISLDPKLSMFGLLLHFYKQYDHFFFDIKSAVLNCKTQINLTEVGGKTGYMPDFTGAILNDAYDAFTQGDWQYGKFGEMVSTTGLDNIQLSLGASGKVGSSEDCCNMFLAGFGIVEFPTGKGSTAEYLFEPLVGTNHWAFGAGTDFMLISQNDYSLVLGGNYRYILKNWETRSFDLTVNGQWSRYLALDTIANLDSLTPVPGLPGINLFTQDALINGRNQVNAYARLQKRWEHCVLELSYNYFYTQAESITQITDIAAGYGIYDVDASGGDTTASTATIANAVAFDQYTPDTDPVTLVTSDLNLASGAAGKWSSNTVALRMQRLYEHCNYGFGGSVDVAASQQAISTWSVWANFEVLY